VSLENASAKIFRQEAEELFEQLEQGLLDLEQRPDDGELVSSIFRALHTIKGSGSVFGFDALTEFTHHVETVYHKVRSGEVVSSRPLIEATLAAKDHMRGLLDGSAQPEAGAALLDRLLKAAETGSSAAAASAEQPLRRYRVAFTLGDNAAAYGTDPAALIEELLALGQGTIEGATPPNKIAPDATAEERSFALTLDCRIPVSEIEDVFLFIRDSTELSIEELPPPSIAATPPAKAAGAADPMEAVVKVGSGRIDALMDQVGELVIIEARLRSLAQWKQDPLILQVSEEIERITGALRETSMSIRMVSIGSLFGRFRRVVRDISRDLGKDLRLITEGEETELDKALVEKLHDPLMHLVRNSADHGLESAEERRAAGKPEQGTIHLSARHVGAEVLISVSDDGRGLDLERIREKAIANGLITSEDELERSELHDLIFRPGFSTAQRISNLSGRGVGLDVVKTAVESLRGLIEISSEPGQGTTMTMRLPLTLAIIDGLMVRVDGHRYVIPLSVVEECVELPPGGAPEDSNFLSLRDELVPYLRLRDVFACREQSAGKEMVVIVATADQRIGLVVDELLGGHQTVVKSLSRLHRHLSCWSGATILGDGRVALILDVLNLIALRQNQEESVRKDLESAHED